jgi:hypothetical protein
MNPRSFRGGNPVVIGMHPPQRGVQPSQLGGRHPGSVALKCARSLSRTAFALKSRQISGLRCGIPSADTSKTSGSGRRIDVSRWQIQVSPTCGSRTRRTATPERSAGTPRS